MGPAKRFAAHSHKNNTNPVLYRAINKGATQEILYSFENEKDAYLKEKEMRPTWHIGWNIIPGGDKPPTHFGNDWFRLIGEQPKVSCSECRLVMSWHRLKTHTCRKVCRHDECNNRVSKIANEYCSTTCYGSHKIISCISCREVVSHRSMFGTLNRHHCRSKCARPGCDNRVKKAHNTYCSNSCSAKERPRKKRKHNER